ncbi:MAG: 23S rRNA (guanosine(2251)-2'-O)-methyltransferase RlmB [Robiginitomaculum sp.]|nr:23S rRNA (guanosine(2251)-2'-O)-methyltransferase RlmB [Robiginitomaculum sp.]
MSQKHKKKSTTDFTKKPNNSKTKQWIWGTHAVIAALNNKNRKINQVLATRNALIILADIPAINGVIATDPARITQSLPAGAVHQGLAVQIEPLHPISLDNTLNNLSGTLLMLDGLTDPRNIGAIFRSAAAFGVTGIIMQDRNAHNLSGVLAKAAAGAVEKIPLIPVVNLSRTLEKLSDAGVQSIGLAGETDTLLADVVKSADKICLVLGSEGKGLRPNVAKHCDFLAKIPISSDMESLNVATAAAIAMYEINRKQT